MGRENEDRKTLLDIVANLKELRTFSVNLKVKVAQIKAKIKMLGIEARRIESAVILEVMRAILDNGRPAYPEEWARKARVEELLAKHQRFETISKQHTLYLKQLVRKERQLSITDIKVEEKESLEQILI